jgi:hypothetical protein
MTAENSNERRAMVVKVFRDWRELGLVPDLVLDGLWQLYPELGPNGALLALHREFAEMDTKITLTTTDKLHEAISDTWDLYDGDANKPDAVLHVSARLAQNYHLTDELRSELGLLHLWHLIELNKPDPE